jgi:hypothetical protein
MPSPEPFVLHFAKIQRDRVYGLFYGPFFDKWNQYKDPWWRARYVIKFSTTANAIRSSVLQEQGSVERLPRLETKVRSNRTKKSIFIVLSSEPSQEPPG